MEKDKKLNIMIGLMVVVFLMQLFLKPSVHIEDNHLGIHYEIEQLREQVISNSSLELEAKDYAIKEYKLIIQNMHTNYNNQDERFEKMLDYTLEAREELEQMNYRYALCYEGIQGHRKEDFN